MSTHQTKIGLVTYTQRTVRNWSPRPGVVWDKPHLLSRRPLLLPKAVLRDEPPL